MLFALLAMACPVLAAWELVRGEKDIRLSIDPAIKRKSDEANIRYLVDFRQAQEGTYRSLVVSAAIRCKARTIALRDTQVYAENSGTGVLLSFAKPTKEEARFRKIEDGSSDVELWERVCGKPKK